MQYFSCEGWRKKRLTQTHPWPTMGVSAVLSVLMWGSGLWTAHSTYHVTGGNERVIKEIVKSLHSNSEWIRKTYQWFSVRLQEFQPSCSCELIEFSLFFYFVTLKNSGQGHRHIIVTRLKLIVTQPYKLLLSELRWFQNSCPVQSFCCNQNPKFSCTMLCM